MPYDKISDLPDQVKDHLPEHGCEIFLAAFNNAWEQYEDPEDRRGGQSREETAYQVAWSAVKEVYEKDENGEWVEK